jgi:acyl dehydratase
MTDDDTALIDEEARAMVGVELERAEGAVVLREFQRWAASVGDHNPLYFDLDYAKQFGHRDVVMPPMYIQHVTSGVLELAALRPDGIGQVSAGGALAFPRCPRRMAGGESMTFYHHAYPGDHLVSVRSLGAIEEKKGRSGRFVVMNLLTRYTRDGVLITENSRTVIARPPVDADAGDSDA